MIPSGRAKLQRSEVGQPVALVVRRNFIRLYGNLPSSKSQRVQNAASMAGISERSGWRLLDMYEGGGSDALVPETPGGANNTLLGNDEIRYLSLLWQSKPGAHVGEYRRQFMMDMNVFVSESAIWNALNNTLRLTRKKKTKRSVSKVSSSEPSEVQALHGACRANAGLAAALHHCLGLATFLAFHPLSTC